MRIFDAPAAAVLPSVPVPGCRKRRTPSSLRISTLSSLPRTPRPGALNAAVSALAFVALVAGSAQAADLCDNTNTDGLRNSPPNRRAPCYLARPAHITQLVTYHWKGGLGVRPGSITLFDPNTGRSFGPFPARGGAGQGGAPNVRWIADVNLDLPAGPYHVLDSDVASWSWNPRSGDNGFAIVRGELTAAGGKAPAVGKPGGGGSPPTQTKP